MIEDHVQTLNPKDFHLQSCLGLIFWVLLRCCNFVDSMDQGLDNGVQFTCRRLFRMSRVRDKGPKNQQAKPLTVQYEV